MSNYDNPHEELGEALKRIATLTAKCDRLSKEVEAWRKADSSPTSDDSRHLLWRLARSFTDEVEVEIDPVRDGFCLMSKIEGGNLENLYRSPGRIIKVDGKP